MTNGEKIRYYREQLGITQGKLAELTGIHPVSIRKYETNKMHPQSPQIEKIAAALDVSYNALNGIENAKMRLETVGDLMGLLMVLYNSNIIQINGKRGDDFLLEEDTVSICFNPLLASYLDINYTSRGKEQKLSLTNTLLNIKSYKIYNDLLKWEKMNFLYEQSMKSAGDNPNDAAKEVLDEIIATREMVELELQRSTMKLVMPD